MTRRNTVTVKAHTHTHTQAQRHTPRYFYDLIKTDFKQEIKAINNNRRRRRGGGGGGEKKTSR